MASKRKREVQSDRKAEADTRGIPDLANQAVATFSDRVVFGNVPDERRRRLVRLTPDPTDEVAAQHPEVQQMMERATALLFDGLGLSAMDEQIVSLVLRRRRVSAFTALMELLNRIPRVEDQLQELGRRGVPREELLTALLMAAQELRQRTARAMPVAKQALGRTKGKLKQYCRAGHKLRLDPTLLQLIELGVEDKIERLTMAERAIDNFTAATRHLTHDTKTPLVRDLRIGVAHVLLNHGISKAEAFRATANLLLAWHPDRFRGLTDSHVRLTYQRRHQERPS